MMLLRHTLICLTLLFVTSRTNAQTCTGDADCDGIPNAVDECPNVYGVIGSPCDDGQTCTTNDVITASCVCTGTTVVCNDNNLCTTDGCVQGVGCVFTFNTAPCDDGFSCTTNDHCLNGICTGTPLPDSDNDGICDISDNCPNVAGQIGSSCNDGQTCTLNDVINASCVCTGTTVVCNDNNLCTTDGCVQGIGCVFTNNTSICDDGNPCTTSDHCSNGFCTGTALPDNDGDGICNINDNCPNIAGLIGSPCNDGQTCTTNDVINASCVCTGTTVVCNDNNPCTTDGCVQGVGCVFTSNTVTCNDGNPCTTGDHCSNGFCVGTALADNDGDGICNINDNCPNVAGQIGSSCNDGQTCTLNDVINASCVCTGTTVVCNDNNTCTTDGCVQGVGCVFTNNTVTCNDGNPCTTGDHCSNGFCVGTALADNDGDGICNINDNCPNIAGQIGTSCNDGQTCTLNDVINASCVCTGTTVVCNDNNTCTTDGCVQGVGCVFTFNTVTCNDGNPCTTGDHCSNGACIGTALPDNDGDGICNVNDNCPNTPGQIGSACSDGLNCTVNDVINANCVCTGTTVVCPAISLCYTSVCTESFGCVSTFNTATCDDGNPCTTNDHCSNGVCFGTALPDTDGDGTCDAMDPCPTNPIPVGAPCNDGLAYTYNDVFTSNCVCAGIPARIAVKLFLEGPYGGGTMIDVLRANGLLPLNEPYSALGYAYTGGGSFSITNAVRNVSGSDALVDWVILELRSKTTPTTIVHSRAALVQRDGDVVDVDGVTAPGFPLAAGPYLLAVRHRNHLPVMVDIGSPIAVGQTTVNVDLTSPSTITYGTDGRKNIGGTMVLWTGDVGFDGKLKYTGSGNDRDPILIGIGSTAPNNTIVGQYRSEDVNLDGTVKYTGTGNDRDPILTNVGSTTPNNVRQGQVP